MFLTGVGTIKCPQIFIWVYFFDEMYFLVHFCTNLKKIVKASLPMQSLCIFLKFGQIILFWNIDMTKNGTIKCILNKSFFQNNRSIWGTTTSSKARIILIFMPAHKNCDSSTHKQKTREKNKNPGLLNAPFIPEKVKK